MGRTGRALTGIPGEAALVAPVEEVGLRAERADVGVQPQKLQQGARAALLHAHDKRLREAPAARATGHRQAGRSGAAGCAGRLGGRGGWHGDAAGRRAASGESAKAVGSEHQSGEQQRRTGRPKRGPRPAPGSLAASCPAAQAAATCHGATPLPGLGTGAAGGRTSPPASRSVRLRPASALRPTAQSSGSREGPVLGRAAPPSPEAPPRLNHCSTRDSPAPTGAAARLRASVTSRTRPLGDPRPQPTQDAAAADWDAGR